MNELLAAYDHALTAYDDCPEHRDAHTLAASRFHAIPYEDVTPTQRTLMKQMTFAYRYQQTITVDRPTVVAEQVPPGYSLDLTHPGSITGRTTKREPELQDLGSWFPQWSYMRRPEPKPLPPIDYAIFELHVLAQVQAAEPSSAQVSFRVSAATVAALK